MIRACIIVLGGTLIPWSVLLPSNNVNAVAESIPESIASEQWTGASTPTPTPTKTTTETITSRHEQCSIYIAPSTIPGAGLGVFTSKPIASGTVIGTPDVIIPIIDLEYNHPSLMSRYDNDSCWMLGDYVWNGDSMMGMHREGGDAGALAPGLDAAINSYIETAGNATTTSSSSSSRINVERKEYPTYDTTLPHRYKYPSAGSMTAYRDRNANYAMYDIPAGAELFKDYGHDWFASRKGLDGAVTVHDDGDDDAFVKNDDTPALDGAVHDYTHDDNDEKIKLELQQQDHIRDNVPDMPGSRCLESIVPGPSAIEGAGRGGFAAWSFQKGQVITGSPLIHITDKKMLELYNLEDDDDDDDDDNTESTTTEHIAPELYGHQLLMNYCWGHPETTLLLCPYGAGINLLNHSRERANVMLQWAPNGHLAQNDAWFRIRVSEMNSCKANLAWDYVALRDIAPGEELFLDYGDAWVHAWEAHVAAWQGAERPAEYADYMSAAEWNDMFADADIRTEQEQREHPYPYDVEVACHPSLHVGTYESVQTEQSANRLWHIAEDGIPCQVLARLLTVDGDTHYTVRTIDVTKGGVNVTRTGVLRKMFRFRDGHYATDMHLPGVFRKEATIPDHMLPMAWRQQETCGEQGQL